MHALKNRNIEYLLILVFANLDALIRKMMIFVLLLQFIGYLLLSCYFRFKTDLVSRINTSVEPDSP